MRARYQQRRESFVEVRYCFRIRYVKESEELMDEAREIVSTVIEDLLKQNVSNWQIIKTVSKSRWKVLWETGKAMILPIILEV